jgi:hypothetical protein
MDVDRLINITWVGLTNCHEYDKFDKINFFEILWDPDKPFRIGLLHNKEILYGLNLQSGV